MITKPDLARELSRLKDFQRDTVEHVFERMYDPSAPTRRFLVADEVGLGKTMVARGVVAKVIDRLWESVPRIDIVYICSNGSIARQNINRLNVSEAKDASLPSRITLLPTVVKGLQGRKLNFISLTPQTSFDLRSSLGTYEERALLYWLLPDEWKESTTAVQNLLEGGALQGFRRRVKEFESEHIDPELKEAFHKQLLLRPEVKEQFITATARYAQRQQRTNDDYLAQRDVIGTLRLELAVSCLGALEPDLIILDEFQRFKHLLDETDQTGTLARELFTFQNARVLMLSATPYKMYTLADEAGTDDHFRDFLQTVAFLQHDEGRSAAFKGHLDAYRDALFSLGQSPDALAHLTSARSKVEDELRRVMVRTERLAVSADRNGMLTEVEPTGMALRLDDVRSYFGYARIAGALDHHDIAEYWKSAPYLLNFMDDYEVKEDFEQAISTPKVGALLRDILASVPETLLNWDDVERYRPLDPANARLRQLLADCAEQEAWRLLWLPPSLPYYELNGPYAQAGARLTKRLMFSSWQVVPKVVAAVLSYEAERMMFGERSDVERPNVPEERERFGQLLRFSRREGTLTGMPVLSLLYPSIVLAELGDPLAIRRSTPDCRAEADHLLAVIAEKLRPGLGGLTPSTVQSGATDEAWYWAAPLLLDLSLHPRETLAWLDQPTLHDVWRGDEEEASADEAGGDMGAWQAHVAMFREVAAGHVRLGAQPPDLADVLAKVALGAPGVVALRALSRICGPEGLKTPSIRNDAGWMAWGFRTLFNLPEVTAMIRRQNADEPYWQRVLEYCIAGCLQAVMDEYLHVLQEWEGVAHRPIRQAARAVAAKAASALQLRTANVGVDAISVTSDKVEVSDRRMRARFAARFGARQVDEGAGAMRADDVRTAFNSPFWPFVLCSTSVGQEGLDFHLYCHALVHWNLPNNPVDLEQREGRIHRYKGHAIRKNAAQLYGAGALASDACDPWERVFELARDGRDDTSSDLTPYWVLTAPDGARIERHVPLLPLSRDVPRADALKRTLTVYRMAFGQNRQEDILRYLMDRFEPEEISRLSEQLRIDLAPRQRAHAQASWARAVESAGPIGAGTRVASISVDRLEDLLNAFVQRRASAVRLDLARARDLLERFAALSHQR